VVSRRVAGYTMLEVVVAMAVFGIFLVILAALTMQMRRSEAKLPVNYMRHPQIISVLSRLRRDVLDAHGKDAFDVAAPEGFEQTEKTLIVESVQPNGGVHTIVWDFSKPGEVVRYAYNVGNVTRWVARGLPEDFTKSFIIEDVTMPGRPDGVRIRAHDEKGRLAIDQILQPRAHE
jgi:prepilin-type N-terminal cleavage/methylation domain-containing protein